MSRTVTFEIGNPGRTALPGVLTVFMSVMFGLPAVMLIATTWSLLPEHPVLVPLGWIGAGLPLVVVYVLRRLMSRYALRVFDDGAVEIVLPFKSVHLASHELAAVRQRHAYVGQGNVKRFWVEFMAADGHVLASVAGSAFADDQLAQFALALHRVNPDVKVPA